MNAPKHGSVEWQLLQLLCDAELPPALRAEVCAKIDPTRFADMNHRTIFEEIRAVSRAEHPIPANFLRESLPGRVTARGFPDLEFRSLFARTKTNNSESLTTELLRSSGNFKYSA